MADKGYFLTRLAILFILGFADEMRGWLLLCADMCVSLGSFTDCSFAPLQRTKSIKKITTEAGECSALGPSPPAAGERKLVMHQWKAKRMHSGQQEWGGVEELSMDRRETDRPAETCSAHALSHIPCMHGLVYRRLIADGDSSVHRKLIDAMPYVTTRQVENVECQNHICRNYVSKVRELCSNPKLGSYELHSALKDIHSTSSVTIQSALKDSTFVMGLPKPGEVNLANEMEKAGLLKELLLYVQRVANNTSSLILDVDNNIAENYNYFVAKFVGVRRINIYLTNSYKTRCEAAVVSANSGGELNRIIHKSSVLESTQRHLSEGGKKMTEKLRRHRLISRGRKRVEHRNKKNLDSDYGPNASLSTPEMSQSTYEKSQRTIFRCEHSPDGLIDDDQIIEVKCSSSAISMPALDALAKGKIKFLERKAGMPQLQLSHNYMYQVQGVLRKFNEIRTFGKEDRKKKKVTKLLTFFYGSLLPEMIDPRHPGNMPIHQHPHIKSAQEAKHEKKKSETTATVETTKIIGEESCVM
ncbi:hypothetical protein PR048_019110 [Dryococelus australis]|uniref:Mutator-like transposase domain-containing protein n=1 Tax=Dryococelus australis TaxID=614101 RepID=A0ABQ9H2P3_9NEOP|nr:hypothetical protein PR048_019110 [Dryococelus australis]